MPIEIEAKIKVSDHDEIRERIRAVGGEHLSDVIETNTFFDTPDQKLRNADNGLRLRQKKTLNGPRGQDSGRTSYIITFKGPAQPGPLKQREELETEVSDGPAAAAIIERLGYGMRLTFEKKRQSWTVQNCQVELDELPLLGTFLEIEGPDAASVESVRAALGLANEGLVRSGYSSLLVKELERTRDANRVVRF